MKHTPSSPAPIDPTDAGDDLRMGSEYATARAYLSRPPRPVPAPAQPKKVKVLRGVNDSDFGGADRGVG